jgi:cation diffusion facilitator CzcD-associated flavoprotein CzcO
MAIETPAPAAFETVDALVVGAGFSGIYLLHRLRQEGFRVRLFDAAPGLGGIWHWNCYPGARVDSTCRVYQFPWDKIIDAWEWRELYPGWQEMRDYFDFVATRFDLARDIRLQTRVEAARFDESSHRWIVNATHPERGQIEVSARYFLMATGIASKAYIPPIEGLEDFAGPCHHTSHWPDSGIELDGKRVGLIGTGASGVQVAQVAAKTAAQLTVFQRTPVIAVPMPQRIFTAADQAQLRKESRERLAMRFKTYAGQEFDFMDISGAGRDEADRKRFFEQLWQAGGLEFWLGGYNDVMADLETNRAAYDFWRSKVHACVRDQATAETLAPATPPHPFGTKRISLEQGYFDIFNQPNVKLVDLKREPIVRVTPSAVDTARGAVELDVLILATGFDMVTGGLTQIDIRGTNGITFASKWVNGVSTYHGLMSAGFPNLLFTYGPQAPTAFANGPSSAEMQGEFIVECLCHLRDQGLSRIEPTVEAEQAWRQECLDLVAPTLLPQANSWYMGANVPGKPREILFYTGGAPLYIEKLKASAAAGYSGYVLSHQGLSAPNPP